MLPSGRTPSGARRFRSCPSRSARFRRRPQHQKKTALTITAAGADYYLALKDNQHTLYALARKKLDTLPAVWISDTKSEHGRIEHRELRVAGFDLDVSLFPGARQVVSLTRHYQPRSGGEVKQETRHFILSIEDGKHSHARLAQIGRDHWSVEN